MSYGDNDDNNNNGNNNNNNNYGYVSEFCSELYEGAARCEKNVKGTNYKDTSSCDLIHHVVPRLNGAFNAINARPTAKVFAWIFGIAIVGMAWYIYRLHKLLDRPTSIDLSRFMGGTSA